MACYYLIGGILFNLCAGDDTPTYSPPAMYGYNDSTLNYQPQLLNQLQIQRELTSPDRLPRCVPGIC